MWSKDRSIRLLGDSISELEVNYRFLKKSEIGVWMPKLPATATLNKARACSALACRMYSRDLHNYLHSFASLIDHMRKIVQDIENTKLEAEYEEEKKKHAIVEVQVVKDLQNFARHKYLPMAGQETGLFFANVEQLKKNNPFKISFFPPSLLVEELLMDKKHFNTKTIQYLQEQGDGKLVLPSVMDKAHQALMASSNCLYKKIIAL